MKYSSSIRNFFFLFAFIAGSFLFVAASGVLAGVSADDSGPNYPRLANIYLMGAIDPDPPNFEKITTDLARYDLVVLSTGWSEPQLQSLRAKNPDIKLFIYVCAYCMSYPAPSGDTWALENVNYANSNDLWWYKRDGTIASDWPNSRMVNVTSSAFAGPQGSWRDYITTRVRDFVSTHPSLDGVFFDNFWERISWEQGTVHLDSDRDGIEDVGTALDSEWYQAMIVISQSMRSKFDSLQAGRSRPLAIMGNAAPASYAALNGSMYENFPKVTGVVEGGNPYNYDWNYLMTKNPTGYLVSPFAASPYRTQIINVMWTRDDKGALSPRTPDFERHKRFTLASALLGDGYYSLDGATSGGHGDSSWWEGEYDNGGLGKGYLGQARGAYYRIGTVSGPELVTNGDFAQGQTSWTYQDPPPLPAPVGHGTALVDTVEFHSAPQALRIDSTSASSTSQLKLYSAPLPTLLNDTKYVLSFWAKASVAQEIQVFIYSSSCPGQMCLPGTAVSITQEWSKVEVPFISSRSAAGSTINFTFATPSSSILLDDVSLQMGDNSVYRRDFEKGSVILNYTNLPFTADLVSTHKRLTLAGSPVFDGALISKETIPAYDARIVLDVESPEAPGQVGVRFK